LVEEKRCDCYELVRNDFFETAKRLMEPEIGVFANRVSLDRLRAVEDMDTILGVSECIPILELAKRRDETEKMIVELKKRLGEEK